MIQIKYYVNISHTVSNSWCTNHKYKPSSLMYVWETTYTTGKGLTQNFEQKKKLGINLYAMSTSTLKFTIYIYIYIYSKISDWRNVSWVSVPAWSISRV